MTVKLREFLYISLQRVYLIQTSSWSSCRPIFFVVHNASIGIRAWAQLWIMARWVITVVLLKMYKSDETAQDAQAEKTFRG